MQDPMLLVVILALSLSPVVLILTVVLHFTVPRKLKEDLVNEKYFNAFELDLEFPGSIFRSLAIARGVAFPRTMRKRFGTYDFASASTRWFRWVCRTYIGVAVFTLAMILMMAFPGLLRLIGVLPVF